MPGTLLSTKLNIPPPRPDLVPRPRLTERLNDGLTRKLTLISAPAGYGKTTLVSDWITHSQIPATWLSLDASDNDLARFFSYLIVALQEIHPDIGAEIAPILETDSDPPIEFEPLLTALVNDIAGSEEAFVLALDDYHVISELEIHESLDFLFDHIPENMHMAILSRADLPMPLGRLRVQRELTEIREADLRFTTDEAAAFLNDLMGLALSSGDIEHLEARTEGWIAGLQLAGLTLQGRADSHDLIAAFSGSHRHLIDYLVHEVLSRQPEEVQEFLLHTSILERFNVSLCDAVLDGGPLKETSEKGPSSSVHGLSSQSREVLEKLERANLFLVPLDDERRWYRYHHLFADFLRQRLRETQPEIIPQLYNRASGWYEAQGMLDEAFHHALAGDDVGRAARLLDENVETLILSRAAVNHVIRWADELPVETRARLPRLCIYHAWALQFEYQLDLVEPTLALAEAHLADPERLPPAEQPASFSPSQITSHAVAIRAYTALKRGELDRAIDLSLAALKALPEEGAGKKHPAGKQHPAGTEHPAKEALVLRGIIKLGLGIGYLNLGKMEAAYQSLQTALPLNQQAGNRYAALSCIHHLIYVNLARGTLNQAHTNGEKGLFWIEEWSRSEGRSRRPARMLAHSRWQMGRVQYERNDLDQAALNLLKATEYYELAGSWWRVQGYADLISLHQALGDVGPALSYLRKLKHISLTPGLSLPDISLAATIAERSLLLSRTRPDLGGLFAEAVTWAETSGLGPDDEFSYGQEYEYLILARVLIAQNRAGEVIPLLDRLITAAEDAGRNGELIAYLSLHAVAHHAQGKTDTAFAYLSRTLALSEPQGYVRTFVDLGPPMRDMLQTLSRQPSAVSQRYLNRLLGAFGDATMDEGPKTEPPLSSFVPDPPSPVLRRPPSEPRGRPPSEPRGEAEGLIEPLSDREIQILHLLAARRSYQEIAEALYLSLNTIKWYTKNIYSKLGVHKRAEAVARGRELGIL